LAACGRTPLDLNDDGGGIGDSGRDDGGLDAGAESGIDAGLEAGIDSGRDAEVDSGADAGRDSGRDAGTSCQIACDDRIDCTDESCDAATGVCLSVPNSSRCPPNQVCRADQGCSVVECRTTEICADGFFCNGAEQCVRGRCVAGPPVDCGGSDCQLLRCDENTRSCVGDLRDDDGDGFPPFECMGGDCDDRNARVFPGAPEACTDGRDNNCDSLIDCEDAVCRRQDVCRVLFEICDNGVDDDRDQRADCADPDCINAPNCVMRFEICNDRFDNDGDGAIDCFDPDCFGDPFCQVRTEAGQCRDGVDNDRDGAIDCFDPDCAMDPACLISPCPNQDLGSRVGQVALGNTANFGNDSVPSCVSQGHAAPDISFQWRAPSTGRWLIDSNGSSYDAVLYALSGGCNGPEVACNDDTFGLQSQLQIDLVAGQVIVIVVDGFASSTGDYVLNINRDMQTTTERGLCADGADNDNDGRVDCADPDCTSDPACQVILNEIGQCLDFVDNDRDGSVDCDDSDCASDMACLVDPTCPDGNLGSVVGPGVIADSTAGQGNDFAPVCIPDGNFAPDLAYAWRAPQAGSWVFDTIGSNYDTALSVLRGSCDGDALACDDDSGGGLSSLVTVTLRAGESVVIVVDGWRSSSGFFVLNIQRVVTSEFGLCTDFIDNDNDGAPDCFDVDCAMDPACVQVCEPSESGLAACTDGVDNDCDGRSDCDDVECNGVIGSECCNGVDDNGDGFVDLFACPCQTSSDCPGTGNLPETCWPRLGVCAPDCSAFGLFADRVCRRINPNWRCQRVTGQCVP